MAGRKRAVSSGAQLQNSVVEVARTLGLDVREQVRVGRRLWGSERKIDVVVTHTLSRRSIGLECKHQNVGGTTEEKIPAIISDIAAWPIRGLVVFGGAGFSANMRLFLLSTGKAIEFEDLEAWLRLYFGLDL